jgi:RimJ/RimL family protein N-acetyltransferase
MFPAGWRQAPPQIETKRLLLRCPREADGPQLYAAIIESLAELQPWFAWAVDIDLTPDNCRFTAAIARERFQSGKEMQFYIFAKGGKKLIGICGLLEPDWAQRTFEICYWLRTSYGGNGYMSEAVSAVTEFTQRHLAAKRIEARCDVANEKGIAVARKAGYILEKTVASETRHHLHGMQTEIAVLVAPQS